MTYQDMWIGGKMVAKGERECEKRYELIRKFCSMYQRPFTVLDIGAADGYFSIRLTEDFADCTVVALEERQEIIANLSAYVPRVILLQHHFSLDDLEQIADVEHFDVVLGLSVIHHFEGSFEERLGVFRSLGDNLILEFAFEHEACGGDQKAFTIPEDAIPLGFGDSHLVDGAKRPIVVLPGMKTGIKKSYIGCNRGDLGITIYSNFETKRVHFYHKPETRDWIRGINLQTYLSFGGCYPSKSQIRDQLNTWCSNDLIAFSKPHNDIVPWNVILQGDAATLIDRQDPNMELNFPDHEYFGKLLRYLDGEAIEWQT